jgi:hypothetical protein
MSGRLPMSIVFNSGPTLAIEPTIEHEIVGWAHTVRVQYAELLRDLLVGVPFTVPLLLFASPLARVRTAGSGASTDAPPSPSARLATLC